MNYQPQISTISATAPPSYAEAVGQPSTLKNNFPLPSFGPQQHSFGTNATANVQPGGGGGSGSTLGQYPTASNYPEYNAPQPPYNPMYVPMETNQTQSLPQPCIVTTEVVTHKNKSGSCYSCMKMLIFSILIICITTYLLKIIISSIMD